MKVTGKLMCMLAVVGIVPLAVFAITGLATYEHALDGTRRELDARTAQYGAHVIASTVSSTERTVRGLARTIPWSTLSDAERVGALVLVYEQLDDVAAVAILDARGEVVGDPIYRAPGAAGTHSPLAPATANALLRVIGATRSTSQTGEPLHADELRAPLLPLSFPVQGPAEERWTLAVGLSLRGVCDELAATSPHDVATRWLDGQGGTICGPAAITGDVLSETAPLDHGWTVIAEQPRDEALAPVHRIRDQALLWVGVGAVSALVAGLVLAQAIRRPLRRLTSGAEALAAGSFEQRVEVTTRDELGTLAETFNRMSDEIGRWNRELQERVEARTSELRQAQDQLLQSRKLGAVAALGAGIAHEINNPLTGVLGMTQLLLSRRDKLDDRTLKSLGSIEREAQRIRDIVDRMQALSQETVRDATAVDLASIVDAVALSRADRLTAANIEVVRAFADGAPRVLGNARQLEDAVAQLVDNSVKAMPAGGQLRLAVRAIEGELVAIEVEDTGRGIAADALDKIFEPFFTTKEDWRGVGLGLSVVHRIVEVHHGRIRAASTPGTGTTMTVTFPAARRGAHLA